MGEPATSRLTAFISGPITFPENYFATHYEPKIIAAIEAGHSFVMGPALGIDSLSLRYLIEHGVDPENITVYRCESMKDRAELLRFVDLGGNVHIEGVTSADRDAAMTRDSDYDILRYMSIEEQKKFYGDSYYPRVSATERNERRRRGLPLWTNPGFDVNVQETKGKTRSGRGKDSGLKMKEWLKDVFGRRSRT